MLNDIVKSFNSQEKEQLKTEFSRRNFIFLPGFLTSDGNSSLNDIRLELESESMRKDFLMPQTNYTPRHISVIGGKTTNSNQQLYELYSSPELIEFLSYVTSNKICLCNNFNENIIFTSLSEIGDTHGWHTDDFPIALIMAIEASPKDHGGELEYLDEEKNLFKIHLQKGDAYIIRSDLYLHRVAPLLKNGIRTILNFTYSFSDLIIAPNGSADLFCS